MKRLIMVVVGIVVGIVVATSVPSHAWAGDEGLPRKTASAMFPPGLTDRARQNAQKYPWAKQACERIVADAAALDEAVGR